MASLPVIVLLAISVIGIILIPVWVILVVVVGFFGYVGAAHLVGKKVLEALKIDAKTMMAQVLTGVVVLAVVGFVPLFGFVIKFIVGCMGMGGVILTKFGTKQV